MRSVRRGWNWWQDRPFTKGRPSGVWSPLSCDISPIFAEVALDPLSVGLELTLQDRTDHLLSGKKSVLEGNPVFGKVDLPDGPWKLAAVPLGGWNAAVAKPLLQFRGVTLAILILLTALIYLLTVTARD